MDDLNCTCHRLRKATRRVTQIYDRHLAGVGLTANQLATLALLARNGALATGALAELAGADASTMTRNLRPLLAGGLIENAGSGDGRVRAVRLAARGEARLRAALGPWRAAERAVARALGGADAAALRDLLARVATAASAPAGGPSGPTDG